MSEALHTLPALWDIQVNGGWGISFADPDLGVDQVVRLAEDYAGMGVGRFCPTLISASAKALRTSLATIARACREDALFRRMCLGVHLEGPWISPIDGYRGAHSVEAVRDPDWSEFESLQAAAEGNIVLVTLAPERPGALPLIERLKRAGVVVAIGHTAASPEILDAAVDAGATLSTHLGNGIAALLPRHPNAILHQAADDRLHASFIADCSHIDTSTLRALTRAKGPGRVILVSDLSPLAGCVPGNYGPWRVTGDGRVVVAGSSYLAGASRALLGGVNTLVEHLGWPLLDAWKTVTDNPARLMGLAPINGLRDDDCAVCIVETADVSPRLRLVETRIGGRTFHETSCKLAYEPSRLFPCPP